MMPTTLHLTDMTWPRDTAIQTPDGLARVQYEYRDADGARHVRARLTTTGESCLYPVARCSDPAPQPRLLRIVGGTDLSGANLSDATLWGATLPGDGE